MSRRRGPVSLTPGPGGHWPPLLTAVPPGAYGAIGGPPRPTDPEITVTVQTLTPAAPRPAAAVVLALRSVAAVADDAPQRRPIDLSQPLEVLLAPVVGRFRARAAAAQGDAAALLLRDLAEAGVLDAGVDAAMARAHGYDTDTHADADAETAVDPAAVVAAMAAICPASAMAVAVQRSAIEILALAERTPANERLLKALRRGAVVAAAPAPGQAALVGEQLIDGSVLMSGRVRVLGAAPGAAVLLRVQVGERLVWAWTSYGASGLGAVPVEGVGLPVVDLSLDRVVLRAGEIVGGAAADGQVSNGGKAA